jgi:hypothetical protein
MGPKLVDSLTGSDHAKRRLKTLLETLSGEKSVEEACEELGLSEAAFHKLRSEFLQEAVGLLEPKPLGRPASLPSETEELREEYERRIGDLEIDLQAARVREEIALSMPHLLQRDRRAGREDSKKNSRTTSAAPSIQESPKPRQANSEPATSSPMPSSAGNDATADDWKSSGTPESSNDTERKAGATPDKKENETWNEP